MSSEVPKGWRIARLGDVAAINPENLGQRTSPDFAFGYIDISQIDQPGVCVGWTPTTFSTAPSRARRVVRGNDIIVSTVRPYLRAFAKVPSSVLPLVASTGFAVVRGREGVDQEFLFQHIMAADFIEHLKPRMTGSNYPAVSAEDVSDYKLRCPPLDEQQRIAEALRSVDEAISQLQRTCDAYAALRSAEVETFAQGSSAGDARPLKSLIASMDSGWSPDCDGEPAHREEWGVLKTSAVTWEKFDDRKNKRLPADLRPRPQLAVARDDILITRAGPAERTGVVAIVGSTDGRRMLSDKLIRIRAREDIIKPLALAELLRSEVVQDQFRALKSGMAASQTNISQKALHGVLIPTVSHEAQLAFVERITNLDAALEAERQTLSTTRVLQKSIVGDLLSGRVRVPA